MSAPPITPDPSSSAPSDPAPPSRRVTILHVTILLLVIAVIWAPRLRGPIDLRYDAAVYYVLGTSIAEGKCYRLLNEPREACAVQYPPLLPCIVAVVQRACGSSDPAVAGWWLRWFNLSAYTGYLLALYALSRRIVGATPALIVAVIAALQHQTVYLSDLLFAEIPFALVSTLLVIFSRRAERPVWFIASAVCAVAGFLLRTAGLALLVAWVGEAAIRRRWRQAALRAVIAAVPVVAWQAYVFTVTHSAEYRSPAYAYQRAPYQYYNVPYAENVRLIEPFEPERGELTTAALLRRAISNALRMPASFGEAVSADRTIWGWLWGRAARRASVVSIEWPVTVALYSLGLIAIGGIMLLAMRGDWLIVLYVCVSAALVCVTPWPAQFVRYLVPVTGFLVLAAVMALRWLGQRIAASLRDYEAPPRAVTWAHCAPLAVATSVAIVIQIFGVSRLDRPLYQAAFGHWKAAGDEGRLFYYGAEWRMYGDALRWLRIRAEPGDVIASATPQWAFIHTRRKSVMVPMEIDADRARQLLRDVPVRYVVCDQVDVGGIISRYALPAVQGDASEWHVVYTAADGKTKVYERRDR